jgi:hypothetical protein
MKTKTLLLLCLFLGTEVTQLSAQQPVVDGTKSVPWDNEYFIWDPVYCNGVLVDEIFGTVIWHNISHFVEGVEVWETSQANGEITSLYTGEVFRVNEVDKHNIVEGIWTWHTNLKGDMGNHYSFEMTSNEAWDPITVNKAVCTENGKKTK